MLIQWAFSDGFAQDSLIIDICMKVGWFSALAAASGRRVVAFEPNPTPRGFMEKTGVFNS